MGFLVSKSSLKASSNSSSDTSKSRSFEKETKISNTSLDEDGNVHDKGDQPRTEATDSGVK